MADKDMLRYFDGRGRAEATRMLYALAGEPFTDDRIKPDVWVKIKKDQPFGQLPVLECAEGTLIMSNSIARYTAKKFGLAGNSIWEEALNDMVVETCIDHFDIVGPKIYVWKVFKRVPEPENSEKAFEEVKESILKAVTFIQSVAEERGNTFIIDDKILLADVWLFASLEFVSLAFPDIMELTPWVKQFTDKVKADERMKKYLGNRPPAVNGI